MSSLRLVTLCQLCGRGTAALTGVCVELRLYITTVDVNTHTHTHFLGMYIRVFPIHTYGLNYPQLSALLGFFLRAL